MKATPLPLQLIVHIGMHKSGSTAIQTAASREQESLLKQGIYYPRGIFPGLPDQHSEIATCLIQEQPHKVADALDETAQLAREANAKTVFLSGEELCKLSTDHVTTLRDITAQRFNRSSFVVVLRNREDYLLSTYKHYLRYSDRSDVFNDIRARENLSPETIIKTWRRGFSNNYKVVGYNSISQKLVPMFFKKILRANIKTNNRENYSLDLLTLYIYNIMLKDWSGPEMDALMWKFINDHPTSARFSMEEEIKQSLSDALPKNGWDVMELPPNSLTDSGKRINSDFDPVEVSERMIFFFSMLRDYFQKRNLV